MPYEPEYTKRFLRDLKRYASLRKQVKKQIQRILEDPFASSKLLTKRRTDWRGKRSQRATRNFRLFFAVCDECLKRSFKRKGYNACVRCEKKGATTQWFSLPLAHTASTTKSRRFKPLRKAGKPRGVQVV